MKDDLFIIELYSNYGGQLYCAVHAKDFNEAIKKSKDTYNINDETFKLEMEGSDLNETMPLEFNENGVSNYWWIGW